MGRPARAQSRWGEHPSTSEEIDTADRDDMQMQSTMRTTLRPRPQQSHVRLPQSEVHPAPRADSSVKLDDGDNAVITMMPHGKITDEIEKTLEDSDGGSSPYRHWFERRCREGIG